MFNMCKIRTKRFKPSKPTMVLLMNLSSFLMIDFVLLDFIGSLCLVVYLVEF